MEAMKIKFKKIRELAREPLHGSEDAAGYDLYSAVEGDVMINPNQNFMFGTGLEMEIPKGTFGAIFARSGIASKKGLRPANCVGVIDSDYRNELMVCLHNDTEMPQLIKEGDRIAQLVLMPFIPISFEEIKEEEALSETERTGGFGSTGGF